MTGSLSIRNTTALILLFLCSVLTAHAQADAYAAATRAYKEKDYAAYLKNLRELSKQQPHNVWLTEVVARAYALTIRSRSRKR